MFSCVMRAQGDPGLQLRWRFSEKGSGRTQAPTSFPSHGSHWPSSGLGFLKHRLFYTQDSPDLAEVLRCRCGACLLHPGACVSTGKRGVPNAGPRFSEVGPEGLGSHSVFPGPSKSLGA